MNSSDLQQKYPEVYQKLFLKCPIVLSAPLGFYWVEHPTYNYNGVMLRQKVPMKVFLGVEHTNSGIIEFGSLEYFSNVRQKFLISDFNDYWPNRLEFSKYIEEKFQNSIFLKNKGLRFHAMVEGDLYGYPLGTQSNISTLIALVLQFLTQNLYIQQVNQWKQLSPKNLLSSTGFGFQEAFELNRIINFIAKKGFTWNTVGFAAMVSTPYPIIAFPGNMRTLDYEYHKRTNFDSVREIPFWGYDLRDLYPDLPQDSDVWPIDFAAMFSGKGLLKQYAKLKSIKTDYGIENTRRFIHEKFAYDLSTYSILPDFYESFASNQNKKEFYTTDLLSLISIRLIQQLYRLLSHGYDEDEVNDFISLIQSRHAAVVATDPISDHIRTLLHNLDSILFHHDPAANFSLFAMYDVSLGGNIGFVSPVGTHREALENAVQSLQKEYPDLSIEYLSWRDGYCSDGVIVEQYMDESIVSKHLGKNLFRVSEYGKESHQEKLLSDQVIGSHEEKSDLTLNLLENTIMIANQPISSKELHSQTATVHVLITSLTSPDRQIKNTDLNRSAYSVSKNEMQGKITGPLCRLIEERTGKKLEILLKGTNQEFTIILKVPQDFLVRTVRKMFE